MRRQENKIPILTENIHTKELQNNIVLIQIRIKNIVVFLQVL